MTYEDFKTVLGTRLRASEKSGNTAEKNFLLEVSKLATELEERRAKDNDRNM